MSENRPGWNRTDLIFLLLCAGFVYLHLFFLPSTPIYYEEDHLYFVQDAWRMFRGEVIYKDFFEYTFPGTQVVYYFLLELFGTKFWIINAVVFAQAIVQAVLSLAISKRLFDQRWFTYLPPSLFLFFGFRWFGIDGSHRMLSPIFIYLAVLILLKGKSVWRIVAAGAFCGLASYFTQQRGILALGALGFFLLITAYRESLGWKRWFINEVVLTVSFAVSLFILVTPFLIMAGPARFFDYTIAYIAYYVQEPTANYGVYRLIVERLPGQPLLVSVVMLFYYAIIPLVYLVTFVYLWRKKYQTEVLLVSLVGFFLALGTFAPTIGRLFQISVPALIILVWLFYQISWRWEWTAKAAVAALAVFGCALAIRLQTNWEKVYLQTPTGTIAFLSPVSAERFEWLSQNARPGEYVFEVYQTAVNFPLQLPNPTRITFLLDSGYTPEWQVTEAIEDLKEKRPRFIIWDGNWNKEPSDRAKDDHLAPLYDLLRQNYSLEKAFTPYNNRQMQAWKLKADE
jgi:hypothetical protein